MFPEATLGWLLAAVQALHPATRGIFVQQKREGKDMWEKGSCQSSAT